MNTNPHGKARCSIGPSSQYLSHVKYQQTARFNSSDQEKRFFNIPFHFELKQIFGLPSIDLKSSFDICTSNPAIQSRTKISHLIFKCSRSSDLQLAFIRWNSVIRCFFLSTGCSDESTIVSSPELVVLLSFSSDELSLLSRLAFDSCCPAFKKLEYKINHFFF